MLKGGLVLIWELDMNLVTTLIRSNHAIPNPYYLNHVMSGAPVPRTLQTFFLACETFACNEQKMN